VDYLLLIYFCVDNLTLIIRKNQNNLEVEEDKRYNTFTLSVGLLNANLQRIYRLLTDNEGDCLLSFCESKTMAFRMGLTLMVYLWMKS
jgi:hypothetical protein